MMATSMLQMLNFVPRITTVIGPEPSDNGLIAADVRASRPGLRCPFGIERLARVFRPMNCVRISHQGHGPQDGAILVPLSIHHVHKSRMLVKEGIFAITITQHLVALAIQPAQQGALGFQFFTYHLHRGLFHQHFEF